jgi:hypothetical protein
MHAEDGSWYRSTPCLRVEKVGDERKRVAVPFGDLVEPMEVDAQAE